MINYCLLVGLLALGLGLMLLGVHLGTCPGERRR